MQYYGFLDLLTQRNMNKHKYLQTTRVVLPEDASATLN